jgi:hypothetical protein
MTNYTIRVELHGADENDYEALHTAMQAEGFVRWIKDQDGNKLRLPTAEYNLPDSELTRVQVLGLTKRAAETAKARPTPWILVTQSGGRTWSGLKAWNPKG